MERDGPSHPDSDGKDGSKTRAIYTVSSIAQSASAWVAGDDWSGIADAKRRRKLQNRLNQRAYRNRKLGLCLTQDTHALQHPPPHDEMPFACVIAPSDALQILQRLEHAMLESYALGSPNTDHLISLSRLNIHKAIDVNIRAVGMDPSWMTSDDSTSIFNKDDAQLPAHAIPPSLAPTEIQRTVPHHPWLDIFPFPSLRDFLISAADELDDETLCHDMCAFWDTRNSGACLMVWGDSWDPRNWEATDAFARKWRVLLDCSPELLESTNNWKRKRGECCIEL